MTTIHNIKSDVLSQWLEENAVELLDVREPAEYRSEHIKGAKLLPLAKVCLAETPMAEQSQKKLVFYCLSGKRSSMACEKIKAENAPFNVWVLEGGITEWKQSGLPVNASGKKVLPLDAQVQLAIGVMVSLGAALGYWLDPLWFILPMVAGIGLINAGLTGFCGLARLIAMMPWNKS
jgi:rhodanese-related sulfurtransferase